MAAGAFGRELVKLEVPVTDVGTDGEICLSEASCSPSVPAFNPWPELHSFPYFPGAKPRVVLHPRRIFLEIGLFSGLFKSEVNEYSCRKKQARP